MSCDIVTQVVKHFLNCITHAKTCLISYKSKNEIVDQAVVKSLQASGSVIMLHSQNAYECVAMVHVLKNRGQQCTVGINFQNCTLKPMQVSKLASASITIHSSQRSGLVGCGCKVRVGAG